MPGCDLADICYNPLWKRTLDREEISRADASRPGGIHWDGAQAQLFCQE